MPFDPNQESKTPQQKDPVDSGLMGVEDILIVITGGKPAQVKTDQG